MNHEIYIYNIQFWEAIGDTVHLYPELTVKVTAESSALFSPPNRTARSVGLKLALWPLSLPVSLLKNGSRCQRLLSISTGIL